MKRRFTLVTAEEPIPQTEDDIKEQLSIFDRVLQVSPDEDNDDNDIDGTQLRSNFQLIRYQSLKCKRFVLFLLFYFLSLNVCRMK